MHESAKPTIVSGTECVYMAAPRSKMPGRPVSLEVILYSNLRAVTAFLDGHRQGQALPINAPKFSPVSVTGKRAYWWSETRPSSYNLVESCEVSTSRCSYVEPPIPNQESGGLGANVNGYVLQITVQNASESQAERVLALMIPSLE